MSKNRPSGKDGKQYWFEEGVAIDGDGAVTLDTGWYRVDAKLATGSGLPENVEEGGVFYAPDGTLTPASGETVTPLTANEIEWATDGEVSASMGATENTTQSDKQAHFDEEGYPNNTYSLSGYNRIDDALQKELKARAGSLSEDDGAGTITVQQPKGGEMLFGTCYWPSSVSGEQEEWSFTAGIITSLTLSKPLKGNQDFSLQMQVNNRVTYVRTIA
ncbi:MAG: hypothetical protein K9L75_06615 [Spirochaetia bacterium]|nr:hypothetical protein [Spirochaetia bacterium]